MKKQKRESSQARICIIASRFNESITQRLVTACVDELGKRGIKEKELAVFWVPGSFEIPLLALKLARKKKTKAVICLGAIIKGETLHYELVAQATAQGIARGALMTAKPFIFEVLAADTLELAQRRAQTKGPNKGRDAALAALEMLDLLKRI